MEGAPKIHEEGPLEYIPEGADLSPEKTRSPDGELAFIIHKGGREEKPNEDRVVIDTRRNQYASVDGMGGEKNGARAAQILAEEIYKGFALGMAPKDIQDKAHARMQTENVGGACYMAFEIDGDKLRAFGAGDVELAVFRDTEVPFKSIPDQGEDPGQVSNAVSARSAGEVRPYEFDLVGGDRVIAGSDGFWEQFASKEEVASLVAGASAGEAVKILNTEAMRRQKAKGGYKDNLNIIVKDFTGSAPEAYTKTKSEKIEPVSVETAEERTGILSKIKGWFGKKFGSGEKEAGVAPEGAFDWSRVVADERIQAKIAGALVSKDYRILAKNEVDAPNASFSRDQALKDIATGKIDAARRAELLGHIKTPFTNEEESNNPQKLFASVMEYEGEIYSMPKLLAELAGHSGESLTSEMLGDMVRQYPDPIMLHDRVEQALASYARKAKSIEEAEYYKQFVRVTLWQVYGKRQEYAEQMELMEAEAGTAYAELAANTNNCQLEIMQATRAEEIFPVMEERVEEILREFQERYAREGRVFDESILYDQDFVDARYHDEVVVLGADRSAELTGVHGWGRSELANMDLDSLARVLGRPLDREKLRKYPYGVE